MRGISKLLCIINIIIEKMKLVLGKVMVKEEALSVLSIAVMLNRRRSVSLLQAHLLISMATTLLSNSSSSIPILNRTKEVGGSTRPRRTGAHGLVTATLVAPLMVGGQTTQ